MLPLKDLCANINLKMKYFFLLLLNICLSSVCIYGQTDSTVKSIKKYQAKAPPTQPFDAAAFQPSSQTTLRWLGMAGYFINSRGTTLMVDPLLKGFDMPIMIDFPISTEQVPRLDAVLVTHADNDHYSVPTNRDLLRVTKAYHSTVYVDSLMKNEGFPSFGHNIGDTFRVGSCSRQTYSCGPCLPKCISRDEQTIL